MKQVMEKVTAVLGASDADRSRVVKTTVFPTRTGDFAETSRIHAGYFTSGTYPARECGGCRAAPSRFPPGANAWPLSNRAGGTGPPAGGAFEPMTHPPHRSGPSAGPSDIASRSLAALPSSLETAFGRRDLPG